MSTHRNRLALILGYIAIFLGVFIVDQSSKWLAEKHYMEFYSPTDTTDYRSTSQRVMAFGQPPAAFSPGGTAPSENWLDFELTYVRNQGAIWGILSDMPSHIREPFFMGVTLVALCVIAYLFKQTKDDQYVYRAALVFALAGALGNFTDRIFLKYVIDLFHFHWRIWGWEYSFPVFNVADISIDIGLALMIYDAFKNPQASPTKKEAVS